MVESKKYRVWCKTCNDFVFHVKKEEDLKCTHCDTIYSEILLKDIPDEKISEQRQRYKDHRKEEMNKVFKMLMENPEQKKTKELIHMLSSPGSDFDTEIHESDAGQKAIDEENKRIREAEMAERQRIKDEQKAEASKYKSLGRNDICICGSGLKYKKCCLTRIQSY